MDSMPEPAAPIGASVPESPMLRLDGFEGPLDLLLEMARGQKVDLARISVLSLVEQYLAAVAEARRVRLELAADWLVMAAWLTWLKSRLLLPADPQTEEEGEEASDLLQARLLELARVGAAASWLSARPLLGQDVFARGAPEDLREIDRSGLSVDLAQLLSGYMTACRRAVRKRAYHPRAERFWTVADALERLSRLLGEIPPGWQSLDQFLPQDAERPEGRPGHQKRAALAGTLLAGLEMARTGRLELRQDWEFGPILLRRSDEVMRLEAAE
ncbi:segregation and condensation protein A [Rhizosaccharibacter radicis]|uniref:Segregation and condensation protein A n=1 Tax=Rhizosaccharibacter radicis TaxID=2782605 RepID=A0ABT1VY61_9PROT|nr:segregation/condensation protein A [Acetobacteraceae bacterium KSS12]